MFQADLGGQKIIMQRTNAVPISVVVDFAARTFRIPSFPAAVPYGTLNFELAGHITNQPPVADAGDSQTIECVSASGTPVTLHGVGSDPDQASVGVSWHKDSYLGEVVSHELQANVLAPFSPPARETVYELHVSDANFQTAGDETRVTVRDTTAPALTVTVDPECLWAPSHKLILFDLGTDLRTTANDACDAQPDVRIASVSSSQSTFGGGSGSTSPDVIYGTHAFCVRAERAGTIPAPREYEVVVAARDASGNESQAKTVVRVGHDESGARCSGRPAPARLVDEGDPRCAR